MKLPVQLLGPVVAALEKTQLAWQKRRALEGLAQGIFEEDTGTLKHTASKLYGLPLHCSRLAKGTPLLPSRGPKRPMHAIENLS